MNTPDSSKNIQNRPSFSYRLRYVSRLHWVINAKHRRE